MIFQATAKNEGNMHVKAKGTLFIRTKEGRTKRRVPLGAGRGIVLPGASLNFRSIVKKPPPGDYVAQAMIRYGRPSPALAEAAFSVGARIKGSESFAASSFLALEVQPEEVVQQVPAGAFRYVNLRFRSQEVESVYVSSKVMDLEYDEEGNLAVVEPAPDHRSCGDWLEVNPTSFALRPGQTKNVAVKVSVPRELAGGYYSCLVFEATTKGVQTSPLAAPFQIPILLNLPIGAELNVEISEINVSASPNNPAEVEVLFKNTGNTHVKPKGKLVLKVWPQAALPAGVEYAGDEEYQPVGEVPFASIEEFVLPGEIRRVGISYPERLPPGKYLAEIVINYGGHSPAESQKEFRIK
ncbi:MAG: hypothetical protein GTO24_22600 [candidate division Zixibacteria bacterium]|nr:hypothetical protein [candidate division Zixibacteria bacterium]